MRQSTGSEFMRRILTVVGTIAIVVGVLGPSEALAQTTQITVGTGIDPGFAPFYVAKQGGFWEKRGLDVDVKLFAAGAESFSSIIAGDVVAADGGGTGCLLAAARSPKVVLLTGSYYSDKFFAMLASSNITSPADLKGKTIATALGTDGEFWVDTFLKQHEMSESDVKIVNLQAPELIAALGRGDIQAYGAWQPWISRATTALGPKIRILEPSKGLFYNHIWICADRQWAKTETAKRFMQGLMDANNFIKANPDGAAQMTAQFLQIKPEVAKEIMGLVTWDLSLDQRTIDGMELTTNWLVKKGKMKPLDYQAFIYPDLLKQLDPGAVNYRLSGK